MKTEKRSVRLLRAAGVLMRDGRVSTGSLMVAGGVGRKAARSDLRLLQQCFPMRSVGSGRKTEWVLDEALSQHRGVLDAISLIVGRQVASFLDGTELFDGLARAGEDNSQFMGARGRAALERKFRCQVEPARRYEEHADLLNDCLTGLVYSRELAIEYDGRSGTRSYERFRPLTLVVYRRALYLFGRTDGEEVRPMAIDRLVAVSVGGSFDYPDDWDPDAVLRPLFGIGSEGPPRRHLFRFHPSVASLVRSRRWADQQVVEEQDDGYLHLSFHATGFELRRFALEWGRTCEVLEPASLRRQVADELRDALRLYEGERALDRSTKTKVTSLELRSP